jgi:hypothetical protein
MKKSEKIIYLITAILILFTCSFYGYLYYSKEKAEYEGYDDYARGSYSIFSSYYNDLKYDSIRAAEASLKGKKLPKGI